MRAGADRRAAGGRRAPRTADRARRSRLRVTVRCRPERTPPPFVHTTPRDVKGVAVRFGMPSAGPQVRPSAGLAAPVLSAVALPAGARSAKVGPLACPPEREARRWVRWSAGVLILLAAALLLRADSVATGPQQASAFASTVASLSERGGYFDTDNLISNERSYLQVIPDLRKRGVRGGAYIGVGPDQNFSYISEVRPVGRVHHRRAARQHAAAPALQGAVRGLGEPHRTTSRTSSAGRCRLPSMAGNRRRSTGWSATSRKRRRARTS